MSEQVAQSNADVFLRLDSLRSALAWLGIVLLIVSSGSTYSLGYPLAINAAFASVAIFSVCIAKWNRAALPKLSFWLVVIAVILLLQHFVLLYLGLPEDLGWSFRFYLKAVFVGLFVFAMRQMKEVKVAEITRSALRWICIHAIIGFMLQFLIVPYEFPRDFPETRSYNFYGIFFFLAHISPTIPIFRAQGVFWEPGVLQMFANLLAVTAFVSRRRKWGDLLVSFLTVILTFSTTGLLLLSLVAFIYLVKSRLSIRGVFLAFFLLVAASILSGPVIITKIRVADSSSLYNRLFDLGKGLTVISEFPFTGIGINPANYQNYPYEFPYDRYFGIEARSSLDAGRNTSNGLLRLLLSFGLPASIFCLWRIRRQKLVSGGVYPYVIVLLSIISSPIGLTNFIIALWWSSELCIAKGVKSVDLSERGRRFKDAESKSRRASSFMDSTTRS